MLDNVKIGNRIALLRREKGLTGEKLAEHLGVSPQAVSKWENGKCLPETALLPAIAAILGTSIDSMLMPKELVILDARYHCGDSQINVTDDLNRMVEGSTLTAEVNWPAGVNADCGNAVCVLTAKYQTPGGTYYAFAAQSETLKLDLFSEGLTISDNIEIVGAYYGAGDNYRSVMHKMQHYAFFNWNEIHVNHETFPSSPGVDDLEYLTVVYTNKNGINVVSCEENGVLEYTDNHTSLRVVDTQSCMLPDITVLEWGANNTMPCTWAGALYAALKFMGEPYTYEQIMGMSGACYRIAFCEVWDWSALDALVAYSYDVPLYSAIGYEPVWACRLEKDDRMAERRRIVSDILCGKPVIAINLRVAAEWGIITGYSGSGKTLYCRTYFDGDAFNENKDYLETENWPFLITHFGEKREKPSGTVILSASLRALIDSFEAEPRDGYFQGKKGYEKWIQGLRNDDLWSAQCPEHDIGRRFDVHLSTVYQLVDARRCAATFLSECWPLVNNDAAALLKEMINAYNDISRMLHEFKEGLLQDGVFSFLGANRGKLTREEQAQLLESAMLMEINNVQIAKQIIESLEREQSEDSKTHGLSDDEIVKAVFDDVKCIYEYTVMRSAVEKSNGNSTVRIKVASPKSEVQLIEKKYEKNDTELSRYHIIRQFTREIPRVYQIDFDRRVVVKEDLSKECISGFHFDEDNESGLFIRKNYLSIVKAAARWHAALWENCDAFGQIGLDWRFETKENLLSHISMLERDYTLYRAAEASGKIPKVWEANGTRFENSILPYRLDCFEEAIKLLKGGYWQLAYSRFHKGKHITVIHGDLHPGAVNVVRSEGTVKLDGLQAVRMGLPTEDLAMLIALHIAPDMHKARPLLDAYYACLCESVVDYSYEMFISDYKYAVAESMFFPIRLINRGIYDFKMRDNAVASFESLILQK